MAIRTTVFHASVHLEEGKLEPAEAGCPFCGGTERRRVYTLQEGPEVVLLK